MNLLKLEEFFEYFKNIDPKTYDYNSIGSKEWEDEEYEGKYCIAGHASIWADFSGVILDVTFAEIFSIDEGAVRTLIYDSGKMANTHKKAVKMLRNFIDANTPTSR